MPRFADHVNLDKDGIVRLDEVGAFAVIANRELHARGKASRFAVANIRELWVDSWHRDRAGARSISQKLSTQ